MYKQTKTEAESTPVIPKQKKMNRGQAQVFQGVVYVPPFNREVMYRDRVHLAEPSSNNQLNLL
jgi:hypothetical protein